MRMSAAERVLECPDSEALAATRSSSDAARVGTLIHRWAERVGVIGRERALAELPPDLAEELADLDPRDLPTNPAEYRQEVAFTYNVATGEAIDEEVPEDQRAAFDIVGHADAVGELGPKHGYVGDLKTGRQVTRPSQNPQMLAYGLAAARCYGWEKVTLELVYIHKGRVWRDTETVDEMDLDVFAGRLRQAHRDVASARIRAAEGKPPVLSEGPHCRFCPALNVCPAKMALAMAIGTGSVTTQLKAGVTRANAAKTRRLLDALKPVIYKAEQALKAIAAEDPIDMGDGNLWGPVSVPGNESLDGRVTYDVIATKYGDAVAATAVTMEATKVGIAKALKTVQDADSLAARERAVLEEIRKLGGAKRGMKESFESYPAGQRKRRVS